MHQNQVLCQAGPGLSCVVRNKRCWADSDTQLGSKPDDPMEAVFSSLLFFPSSLSSFPLTCLSLRWCLAVLLHLLGSNDLPSASQDLNYRHAQCLTYWLCNCVRIHYQKKTCLVLECCTGLQEGTQNTVSLSRLHTRAHIQCLRSSSSLWLRCCGRGLEQRHDPFFWNFQLLA